MEANECYFCGRGRDEAKLVHAIHTNEVITLCEDCSTKESIPIIRKPTISQLSESEKPYNIRQRIGSMSGIKQKQESTQLQQDYSEKIKQRLEEIRKRKAETELMSKRIYHKSSQATNLIDNFHWKIMMARKNKKLDRKQLAEAIGESESAIRIIESGEVPDDAYRVINKIEQYFNITLRKNTEQPISSEKYYQAEQPSTILKINREKLDKITIADLVKMKKQKDELEKPTEEPVAEPAEKQTKSGFFSRIKKWFSEDENTNVKEETESKV